MEPANAVAADLPPGVSQAQPAVPVAAPVAPGTEAAPVVPDQSVEIMEEGGDVGKKWNSNPMEIAFGILLFTLGIFTVVYYREKALQKDKDIKEHDEKLSMLQSDINSMKNPEQQ